MAEDTNLGEITPDAILLCRIQCCRTLWQVDAGCCDVVDAGVSVRCDNRVAGIRGLHQHGAGSHGNEELASAAGTANRQDIHDCAIDET